MEEMNSKMTLLAAYMQQIQPDVSEKATFTTHRHEDFSHFITSLGKVKYWSRQKVVMNLEFGRELSTTSWEQL